MLLFLSKFDANGVSVLSFKKNAIQEFFQITQYLLATNSIDTIAGNFNCDILKVSQNKFLDIFTDHIHMVNKPTHTSGSLIDHVHIKKALMEELFTNVTVENIHFSDHDAVKIATVKNYVVFHINL